VSLSDVELARHIAETAGRILVELQNSGLFEGKALGKAGDRTANALIIEALKTNRPDDAVLSEEEQDNAERLKASRVWIVDPLDGTREYGEKRTDWSVHIALSIDGEPTLGAVALPGIPLTLCTGQPQTVPPSAQKLCMLVSRTRPAAEALAVAKALDAELVLMGSLARRRWPFCAARPISICIPADNMNVIIAPPPRLPSPPGCTPRAPAATHFATIMPIPICRTYSSAENMCSARSAKPWKKQAVQKLSNADTASFEP